jgi:hypothetical protein
MPRRDPLTTQFTIMGVISANVLSLACFHDGQSLAWIKAFDTLDKVFTAIFAAGTCVPRNRVRWFVSSTIPLLRFLLLTTLCLLECLQGALARERSDSRVHCPPPPLRVASPACSSPLLCTRCLFDLTPPPSTHGHTYTQYRTPTSCV